jgi:hypothetical protein
LRLLQFKNQLQQLNRYFQLKTGEGIKLNNLRPVLTPEDVLLIMEDVPTRTISEDLTEHWYYDFQKRYIRGQGEAPSFDFSQILTFEQEKLASLHYTSTFLTVFEPLLLEHILQAIGEGTFDQEEERLVFHWNLQNTLLPTQQQMEVAWGAPYSILPIESEQRHVYIFTLQIPDLPNDKPVPILSIWLIFHPDTQYLERIKGWYKSTSFELNFAESVATGYLAINL